MSTRTENYTRELAKLVTLLRRKAWTASELAKRMACSKPTIYARLQALEGQGYGLTVGRARTGTRGPEATSYTLAAG